MMAILRQRNGAPLPFERQAVIIFAAINGFLQKVPVGRVPEYEEKLMSYLDAEGKHVLESIARSKDIVVQTEEELKQQLKKFEEVHPDLYL